MAQYSLEWSRTTVASLRRKHARGTDELERILEINDGDLAKFLSINDPVYRFLRECIKAIDEALYLGGNSESMSDYEEYIRRKAMRLNVKRVCDRLDTLRKEARMKEPLKKGPGPEAQAEDPGQQYLLFGEEW
jgi:hypothetical protein